MKNGRSVKALIWVRKLPKFKDEVTVQGHKPPFLYMVLYTV